MCSVCCVVKLKFYSQPYTAFNFAIDKDQKALFPTAKGRFRLFISATDHPYVFVSVYPSVTGIYPFVSCMWSYITRMYPYVTRMLSMCFLAIGTRMCPHVSVCYSYITRMLPLCICVVFLVKIRVNDYRQS